MEGSLGPFDRDKARQNITRAPGYLHTTERQNSLLRLWSAICFKIMTRSTCGVSNVYLQSFPLHDIRAFFCHVYLRSFLLCGVYMTIFLQTRIYMRYRQAGVYGATESRRIRGTELYRKQKTLHVRWSWKVTTVWIKHSRNGRVNFEQGLVLIHCPRSSGCCWLPGNGFVGIRGLSLERLVRYFTNADRNNDRFS